MNPISSAMIVDQPLVKPCRWCHQKPGQETRIIDGIGFITVCHDCKKIVDRQLELGKEQCARRAKTSVNTKRGWKAYC